MTVFASARRRALALSSPLFMIRLSLLAACVLALLLPRTALQAQTAADSAAVRSAAMDYLDGFYLGDTTRFLRSIHPEVAKTGFAFRAEKGYEQSSMAWAAFHRFAEGVRAGRIRTPENAPKEVRLLDVADQIAVARVTAWWGIDYLHLAKFDGRWQIVHVLWQSPPRR